MSSVMMRERGETVPSTAGDATASFQLLCWVDTAESFLGGDCLHGFSVLLNAAGTYIGGLRGSMVGTTRLMCSAACVVRGEVGDMLVGVFAPEARGE
jgi:hypothetical protein